MEALGAGIRDGCQFFRVGILVQAAVREYEDTVFAVSAVRNVHDEETGYDLAAGGCLQDLQSGTECIRCRVAGAGDDTVRVTALEHHDCIGNIVTEQDLSGLLGRHSLFGPEFGKHFHIMFKLVRSCGILNFQTCQIDLQPAGTVHDLLFITDHDQIRKSFLQDVRCRDQYTPVF